MREQVLKDFFEGNATAAELSADIAGSTKHVASIVSYQRIEDMEGEFSVTRPMLITLCDSVLAGNLLPETLHEIGFALVSSDHFLWDTDDDELVTEIINDWSCPEINYPLTLENVRRFKSWLINNEAYPFQKLALGKTLGRVISVRHKGSTK
jgi:hypothetical protein